MARRALELEPGAADREAELGRVYFDRAEFRVALPYLTRALERMPGDADLHRRVGLATAAIGDLGGSRAYLERARELGGDSVYATSALAETAAGEGDWPRAAREIVRAVEGLRPTLRRPLPGALQQALEKLALSGPPEVAAPVFERVVERLPHWDLAYHGGARVNARWGGERCRRAAELASEMPRFGWTDREVVGLLASCAGGGPAGR
jgi:tetratricopeptide (TPR) repeat protein